MRTALVAYALASRSGRRFVMRVEDIDRVREGAAERQLADLAALGLTWQEPVLYQSKRTDAHAAALATLADAGRTYECYCSRRDIAAAPSAPHRPPGAYPGTCRNLDEATRAVERKRLAAAGRRPSIRLRAEVTHWTVNELLDGVAPEAPPDARREVCGSVDDLVLRRGDGVLAYNLVSVLDDAHQGVDQVCRGVDLLSSSPRQAYLAHLLGLPEVTYAHVPLVVNPSGVRLAKRDGAVTLEELRSCGWTGADVVRWCAQSLGLPAVTTAEDFVAECSPARLRSAGGPHIFAPPR